MLEALSLDILGPAFLAGILVLATHVPLGSMVLDRGIVFIDIAVAQVAALGVVVGASLVGEIGGFATQISALSAALLCSVFLIWSEKKFPEIQEAIIGVSFVVAAALQIIVLSTNPGGAEHLKDLLVGQILLVSPGDLLPILIVYSAVLALWAWRDFSRERLLFYGAFAVVITLSVQIVGVLLVFASLIVPALAARSLPPSWRIIAAFNVGVVGYALGLIVSALTDFPTGATIVCTVVATAIVVANLASFALPRRLDLGEELAAAGTHGPAPAPFGDAAEAEPVHVEADVVPLRRGRTNASPAESDPSGDGRRAKRGERKA